jgi:hypothetical protein
MPVRCRINSSASFWKAGNRCHRRASSQLVRGLLPARGPRRLLLGRWLSLQGSSLDRISILFDDRKSPPGHPAPPARAWASRARNDPVNNFPRHLSCRPAFQRLFPAAASLQGRGQILVKSGNSAHDNGDDALLTFADCQTRVEPEAPWAPRGLLKSSLRVFLHILLGRAAHAECDGSGDRIVPRVETLIAPGGGRRSG